MRSLRKLMPRRAGLWLAGASVFLAAPSMASAADYLAIPDASVVKYVVDSSGLVYLRNLNEVDASWAGCCNNFWMNLNTDAGRGQFSAFLAAKVSHQRIVIYADSKTGSSTVPLLHVGDF